MKKRFILPILVASLFFLHHAAWKIATEIYTNNQLLRDPEFYEKFHTLQAFSTFIYSSVFFIIIIAYFREHRLLNIFAISAVIGNLSFAIYTYLMFDAVAFTDLMRVFAGLSYFTSLANIIITSAIILQERHYKIIRYPLIFFAIYTYIFASFYTGFLLAFLRRIFGPFPNDIMLMTQGLSILIFIAQIGVVIFQTYIVYVLFQQRDANREYRAQIADTLERIHRERYERQLREKNEMKTA